jgi:F-type H+-transporting ATPase subunit beta
VKGFRGVIAGEYHDIPEQAFYMKGTTEDALETRDKLQPQKLAA